ncbi:MAG TPA: quinohemoprotein amine dehydrogenase subunit alpha [Bryobacteraceae bacterium]|nr:quinohemoprotein amine dehydrogenase subunit alpha [Bryobacteraceae bacterium]
MGALCFGEDQAAKSSADKSKEPKEDGIPVTNGLVVEKCGACHKKDEKGAMTRISWVRTTPEGWELAIKRMVRLNGVTLTPEQARAILKYLSTYHGLAPEEGKPVMYIAEHRIIDEKEPNDYVRGACMICHALGRAMSWRRSKEEWTLLANMHVGYFPVVEFQGFRREPPQPDAPPPAPGTDTRDPVERAAEYFAKTYPLETPEWAAWRARMRTPKLTGRWLLSGREIGHGRIYGEMVVEPGSAEDEFTTNITMHYVKDGRTEQRTGRALVYTGYQWRGRSHAIGGANPAEVREVMAVSADQSQIEGRWFWGAYEEFGIDATLRRAGNDAAVLATDRTALRSGATGERVRIFGDNFPAGLAAADFDFGSGVAVKRVVGQTANDATVEVDVSKDAVVGARDVAVRRAVLGNAYAVFDKIDYIKVIPETPMARLGGGSHPKGYQQFEAVAFNRGLDGKPNTADDVDLGPVEVEWSIEEFLATYGDDDKDYVGTLSPAGLFTPALEGPNPKRKFGRNNYGDVWVVGTYKPKGDEIREPKAGETAKPVTGRAYLIVTVPLYVKWDQPEVAQ